MKDEALESFISSVRSSWEGLNTNTVINCRSQLAQLAVSSNSARWLAELQSEFQESIELYRDADYGFILQAHIEHQGLYRAPHNHGLGWVCYAVQSGQMEMSTYSFTPNRSGNVELVSRGSYLMNAADCQVFLPGDIHDTRCLSESVVMLRLTSCDLRVEKLAGRLIQYTV